MPEMTVGKIEQLTHEQKVLRARENADESFSKLKDENASLRSRVAELEGREKILTLRLKALLGLCASCRRVNTNQWLWYLAEGMNEALESLGDKDRVMVNPRGDIHIAAALDRKEKEQTP